MISSEKLRWPVICLASSAIILVVLICSSRIPIHSRLFANLDRELIQKNVVESRKLRNDASALSLSLGLETSILGVSKRKKASSKTTGNTTKTNYEGSLPRSQLLSESNKDTTGRLKDEIDEVVMGVDENGLPVRMKNIPKFDKVKNATENVLVTQNQNVEDKVASTSAEGVGNNIIPEKKEDISIPIPEPKNLEDQLFYMYDLGEEFWWRWPKPESDCSQNGYMTHTHAELSGIGPPILPDEGLFLTWHFSLFSSLFNRMKRSKRRTLDPEKASLFIIPYDLGLDGYLDANTCTNSRRCTKGHPEKVQEFVMNMPYFKRYEGRDHAVLWSLGQYHPWPFNGCDLFMRNFCEKCTFTCYWMDPTKEDNRFVSIPFPSGYHWWDGIKDVPWELGPDSSPNSLRRNLTAVYLGSTQTLNPAHTKIRRAMTAQCNSSSDCHWKQISHSSTDNNIAELLSIYRRSVFCLCPPGDDPARKAVFDSILSGCIPVIFEVATLYNQYPWHLGEEASLDISVNIPGGLIRSNKLNLMDVLNAIPKETIRLKQIAIAKYAPSIQYAVPPLDLLKNRSDVTPWDPPFRDGVDCTLDGLFVRTGHSVRNQSTGIPHRLMTSREWSKEYDVVKVKIPGQPLSGTTPKPGQGQGQGVFLGGGIGGLLGGLLDPESARREHRGKSNRSGNNSSSSSSGSSSPKGTIGHKKNQKKKHVGPQNEGEKESSAV